MVNRALEAKLNTIASVFRRTVALLCAFMITLFMMAPAVNADDSVDTSFYKLGSVASGWFSTAASKGASADAKYSLTSGFTLDSGDAGGLLGYSDNADEDGLIEGWIHSMLSSSSATFSYQSLLTVGSGSSTTTNIGKIFWQYCQKGRTLSQLGLDKTATESAFHPIKLISGNLMKIAYLASSVVDKFFDVIIDVLITLNPFRFFKDPNSRSWVSGVNQANTDTSIGLVNGAGFSGTNANGNQYYGSGSDGLDNMAQQIQAIYSVIYQQRIWILGALFMVLLFSLAVSKGGNSWQKIRKFLIRAAGLTIMVPLIASLYTSCLAWMSTASQNATENAGRIVLSTYVDFEKWARDSRLAMPFSIFMQQDSSTGKLSPSPAAIQSLRNLAYRINTGDTGVTSVSSYGVTTGGVSTATSGWLSTGSTSGSLDPAYVTDVLDRYSEATMYYASSFESDAKQAFTYDQISDLVQKTGTTIGKFAENKASIFVSSAPMGAVDIWTNGTAVLSSASEDSTGFSLLANAQMSTMSMYNYLTSKFTENSVIVYSNEKAPSGFVRESHYAVNMIGTGLMSFLYWLNAIVLLGSNVIIGFFYGMALIGSAVKRMILLISAIPFALIGSLRSIARVIIYALAMIAEVVMTMLAYYIVSTILLNLTSIVETPLVNALTSTIVLSGAPSTVSGATFMGILIIVLIMSTLLTIMMVSMAMKVRNSLVKFIDELLTETIDTFLGVKSGADMSGGSGGGKMAGALAAGAGAGLAHKLSANADSKGQAEGGRDAQGVAVDKDNQGGEGEGAEGGNGDPQGLPPGDAAGGGDTNIETNIDDNDTASASFDGDDDSSEQAEIAAAGDMEALADGAQAEAEAQAGDIDAEGIEAEQAQAEIEGSEALAAGESAEDQQAIAQDMGEQAQVESEAGAAGETADGAADGAMAETDSVEDQQAVAQETGEDAQAGQADAGGGAAGAVGDGKNGEKPGAVGVGNKAAAVGVGGKSKSMDQALQRNADARQKLAAAQSAAAKAGVPASAIAGGGKAGAAAVGTGGKAAALGPDGKPLAVAGAKSGVGPDGKPLAAGAAGALGPDGKPVAGAVAGASGVAGAIPAGGAPAAGVSGATTQNELAAGANGSVTQNALSGAGNVPGAVALDAGGNPVAGAMPAAGAATVLPGGAAGNQVPAAVISGQESAPAVGAAPAGGVAVGAGAAPAGSVAVGGGAPAGAISVGGSAPAGAIPVSGGAPAGAIPVSGGAVPAGGIAVGAAPAGAIPVGGGAAPAGAIPSGGAAPAGGIAVGGAAPAVAAPAGGPSQVVGAIGGQAVALPNGTQALSQASIASAAGVMPSGVLAAGATQSSMHVSDGKGNVAAMQAGGASVVVGDGHGGVTAAQSAGAASVVRGSDGGVAASQIAGSSVTHVGANGSVSHQESVASKSMAVGANGSVVQQSASRSSMMMSSPGGGGVAPAGAMPVSGGAAPVTGGAAPQRAAASWSSAPIPSQINGVPVQVGGGKTQIGQLKDGLVMMPGKNGSPVWAEPAMAAQAFKANPQASYQMVAEQSRTMTRTMTSIPDTSAPTRTAAQVAAAAAIAAFMASSDNPVVRGTGSAMMMRQQMDWNRSGQRGGGTAITETVSERSTYAAAMQASGGGSNDAVVTKPTDSAVIAEIDSQTAQIEAEVARLNAQTMQSLGKRKALPETQGDEI